MSDFFFLTLPRVSSPRRRLIAVAAVHTPQLDILVWVWVHFQLCLAWSSAIPDPGRAELFYTLQYKECANSYCKRRAGWLVGA